jgi:3-hydroxyacyl-CoA dehydrogenase
MKLVELVPGEDTRPEVISTLANFLGHSLGKGVVYAKDTVNFIGNRIGCMWMFAGLQLAEKAIQEDGLSIETVDALMSEPMGFPGTGLFGLIDLVGLDVMHNVGKNLAENLPENDFGRKFITFSDNLQAMVDRGQLGRKTGGGFYKLIRHDDGSKTMQVFDIIKHDWNNASVIELPESEQSLRDLFKSESANARFVQDVMATTLCYTADLVPDIADDIVNVDRAMRWGFAWQRGPFELIDELGVQILIDIVNEHKLSMPKMLQVLIDSGESTFYRKQGTEYLTTSGIWKRVPE